MAEQLEDILEQVENMTEEELAAEAQKILERRERQRSYQVKSPEAREKAKLYRQKRYARERAVLAKAKELGLL